MRVALLAVAFLGAGLLVYAPALDGAFLSDDQHYVQDNPYIQDLTPANLWAVLDPTSVVSVKVENYAPVHLLLHALEWQLFADSTRGYHVVNVVCHALASLLLVLLFQRSGVPPPAAALAGALFLVHPANVEAVAWISQLKTSSSLALSLAALLAHPRRPGWGAVWFALALLAKPTAAFALPVVAVLGWVRRDDQDGPWHWGWVAGWLAILAVFAVAEFAAFAQTAGQAPALYPELDVRIRTTFAIGLRYLAMAASSYGLSTFHEPPAADSPIDPWWLASLPMLALLGWRTITALRGRREEAAYWVWAAAAFGPICGVIPLPFPMADRYLYFILPGLLGGVLLMGGGALAGLSAAGRRRGLALALAVTLGLLGVFVARTYQRAHVWRAAHFFMADAERNYPDGAAAKTRQAHRAAAEGDVEGAVRALRAARARGYNRLDHLLADPAYRPLMGDPRFRALMFEMANEWLERLSRNDDPSQDELRVIAQAQIVLDDLPAAERAMERALRVGGPVNDKVRSELEEIRRQMRLRGIRP